MKDVLIDIGGVWYRASLIRGVGVAVGGDVQIGQCVVYVGQGGDYVHGARTAAAVAADFSAWLAADDAPAATQQSTLAPDPRETPPLTYAVRITEAVEHELQFRTCGDIRRRGLVLHAKNGVELRSVSCPDWRGDVNTLFLPGDDLRHDDHNVPIHAADWPRVKQALDEYGAVEVPW